MAVVRLFSRSPRRITVQMDGAPSVTASDYVISRSDGGASSIAVTQAFTTDSSTVELALTPALDDDTVYSLSYQGGARMPIAYRTPSVQSPVPPAWQEDPEAEAMGVDVDWLADQLTARGDLPDVRGRQCMQNDLALTAIIIPGEIYHRPQDGAALQLQVNGPSLHAQIADMRARVKRQWLRDSRVKRGGIDLSVKTSTAGQVELDANVQPVAIDDPIAVKTPGGST